MTASKSKTPQELSDLVTTIFNEHVSRQVQKHMRNQPETTRDDLKCQMAMFSADILTYFDLRDAIHTGNVGRMEDLFSLMLFRFMGGGNHKYATEVLELMQKLRCEWPEELQ